MTLKFEEGVELFTGPFDRCIYCGNTEGERTDEHAIPQAIGGGTLLKSGSCKDCQDKIDPFEGRCHNKIFLGIRTYLKITKTKALGRQGKLPAELTINSVQERARLKREDHPTIFSLVSFDSPGILRHDTPKKTFERVQTHAISLDDPISVKSKLERIGARTGATRVHIEVEFPIHSFGRYLAKIAHATAVARFGLGAFEAMLPQLIMAAESNIAYLVGTRVRQASPQKTEPNIITHQIAFELIATKNPADLLLCAFIRFFIQYPTPEYQVVVGRPDSNLCKYFSSLE